MLTESGLKMAKWNYVYTKSSTFGGSDGPMFRFTCTWNSRDTVPYSFALACLDKQPMRVVMTGGPEVQTFLEGHCMKCMRVRGQGATPWIDDEFLNPTSTRRNSIKRNTDNRTLYCICCNENGKGHNQSSNSIVID